MIEYTVEELELVIKHSMDIYHRDLMIWAVKRIKDLELKLDQSQEIKFQQD